MNWLGYTEAEVWQLTPRKWYSLVEVHKDLFSQQWGGKSTRKKPDAPTGFIDQIGW